MSFVDIIEDSSYDDTTEGSSYNGYDYSSYSDSTDGYDTYGGDDDTTDYGTADTTESATDAPVEYDSSTSAATMTTITRSTTKGTTTGRSYVGGVQRPINSSQPRTNLMRNWNRFNQWYNQVFSRLPIRRVEVNYAAQRQLRRKQQLMQMQRNIEAQRRVQNLLAFLLMSNPRVSMSNNNYAPPFYG